MNEHRREELLTRWTDGLLSGEERAELEPFLREHPELEEEREEFLRLRDELRAVLPTDVEPPYPDFFNTHLMRQIREGKREEVEEQMPVSSGFWKWLSPWVAPAAAAAVVVAFIAGRQTGGGAAGPVVATPQQGEAAPAVYSAISSVDVRTWQSPEEGSTVIVLDGLQEIPSSIDLLETTAALETTEGEDGVF